MKAYTVIAAIFFILGGGVSLKLSTYFQSEEQTAQQDYSFNDKYESQHNTHNEQCNYSEKNQYTASHKNGTKYVNNQKSKNQKNNTNQHASTLKHAANNIKQHLESNNTLTKDQWTAIKSAPGAATYLLDELNNTFDPQQRKKIEVMMRNLPKSEKLLLTQKLVNETNENDRRLAYALLKKTPTASLPNNVAESVAYNLYQETTPDALIDNLSIVRKITSSQMDTHSVLSHVNQLTQHQDANVRAQALDTLSYMNNSQDTLNVVMQGLDDSNPKVRQAAAIALFNYDELDEDSYNKLLEISSDLGEDNKVKEEILAYLSSES